MQDLSHATPKNSKSFNVKWNDCYGISVPFHSIRSFELIMLTFIFVYEFLDLGSFGLAEIILTARSQTEDSVDCCNLRMSDGHLWD